MITRVDTYTPSLMVSTNEPIREISDSASFSTALAQACGDTAEVNCSEDLEGIFQEAADTYGISANLLKAVAKAESDFDPNCTSSAGAMGIMQLMPETAKSLGVTDAYDVYQNIMAGAKYLSENLDIFNGDTSLALAAYNAGRGAVKKYSGIPPYNETQNYVKKIIGYLNVTIDTPTIPNSEISNSTNMQEQVVLSDDEKKALERLQVSAYDFIIQQLS